MASKKGGSTTEQGEYNKLKNQQEETFIFQSNNNKSKCKLNSKQPNLQNLIQQGEDEDCEGCQ